jgi:transcription attenuation protein (tryptophan RNA-binding attenuator protein)
VEIQKSYSSNKFLTVNAKVYYNKVKYLTYVNGEKMEQLEQHYESISGDYALEDGVTIIGLTRGKDTKFNHTEKLDRGEVMIFQFTEHTSAMKIRGKAEVHTKHGIIKTGKE